jgi:amino acid permease
MKQKTKNFLVGCSILIGTSIGAGVLGIPFVAAKAGFLVGLGFIIAVGLIVLLVNLYLGEIILRTKGNHQLVGYAEKYLGVKGKRFMNFAMIFVSYAAIIAYLFGVGESFTFFFNNPGPLTSLWLGLAFAAFMGFMLWEGLKALKLFEKWGVALILSLLVAIIFIFFSPSLFPLYLSPSSITRS